MSIFRRKSGDRNVSATRKNPWSGDNPVSVFRLLIPALALLTTSCSIFEPSEQTTAGPQAEPWYNMPYLRPVFGDYDRLESVVTIDPAEHKQLVTRGAYLVSSVAACGVCHGGKPGDPASPLSGGRLMEDSFGSVYAANITSDRETGIGKWNVLELIRAIRSSIGRDGHPMSIDTHRGYRWMSDADARAISEYLLVTKPVANQVERRRLGGFERNRLGLIPLHQPVQGYVPVYAEAPKKNFGRYLAQSVSQCVVCHTDRGGLMSGETPFAGSSSQGTLSRALRAVFSPKELLRSDPKDIEIVLSDPGREELRKDMAAEKREEGESVEPPSEGQPEAVAAEGIFPALGPDIRGQATTGLAAWSEEDIVRYLSSGKTPRGTAASGALCPWPFYQGMSKEYKYAIANYLKSL